jgi:putative transposase
LSVGLGGSVDRFSDCGPIRGRICFGRRKINLSTVFAGQNVGVKEVSDKIWLVTFMDYDLGFFDHETGRLENIDNPFAVKALPMSSI